MFYPRFVYLTAPTGRAARVLSDKVGHPASTIHRAIYSGSLSVSKDKDIADARFMYHFKLKDNSNMGVVIVDEASMLSSVSNEHELFRFGSGKLIDDLLTFSRVSFGGKLILIGDPAQLPPIGESESKALIAEYFEKLKLKVLKCELTEVVRQDKESAILKNAMQIRDLLQSDHRNHLVFETKSGEVEEIPEGELLNRYIGKRKETGRNNCILIAFSNQQVQQYNREIRQTLFGEENPPLRAKEVLMVVHNNYTLNVMNGEFVQVEEVKERTSHKVPVYVQEGADKTKTYITLDFIRVKARIGNTEKDCWLYGDLLHNDEPSLSIDEHKAFYIDFCIRHRKLQKNTQEFTSTLLNDKFYNCLKAKFGYAVTGHKCQGGEWGNVFVDYSSRSGLSDDCLRWAYTVTTRSNGLLCISNLPHITPFSRFRIDDIGLCSDMKEECMVIKGGEKSPFHADNTPDYLRAKCRCIIENMDGTPYSVVSVNSTPYMEIYYIQTPDGMERYDIRYKKGGLFAQAVPQMNTRHSNEVCQLLNDERGIASIFDYKPSDDIHARLYDFVRSACQSTGIQMSNIVEHPEDCSCIFYFRTSGTMSYLKVYINKNGFVTYAKPMSLIGTQDSDLQLLIDEIQTLFQ